MVKNKIVIPALGAFSCVIIALAVAVPLCHAWDVKIIDYETHLNNTNLSEGSYIDTGAWVSGVWPTCSNGGYRYLTRSLDPQRRGIAYWLVQVPVTGFYKLETSYRATENRTSDADYAVYVNATTAAAANKTSIPVYALTISQIGSSVPWVNLGTYCFQENDISMIVLNNMDDSGSAATDASRWTYVGDEYNSTRCGAEVNMAPVNYLLLK